jgi:hypothetical protein
MITLGEVVGTIGRFTCHRLVRICETAASVAVRVAMAAVSCDPPSYEHRRKFPRVAGQPELRQAGM